jgi:dTDP-6-deoxy-L-talose 4-dehydrogenase (NAD+)
MKILVTGAGGYIGRHIVTSLLDMGAHVIATDLYVNNIDIGKKLIEEGRAKEYYGKSR